MDNVDDQEEKVSFRQESVDNVFSQGRKPFFVASPTHLSVYTLVFVCFLIFIFASIYFIKLPVHIQATGEVIAGKDYHQIVVNEDDQVVSKIMVSEGEQVVQGQTLLQLDSRNKASTQTTLRDTNLQIRAIEDHLNDVENYFQVSMQNIRRAREGQFSIVEQLENELLSEKKTLIRYQENVAKGLTSALLEDTQKRVVSKALGNLIKEKSVFTTLDLSQLEIEDSYSRQKDSDVNQINRLKLTLERLNNGQQILSPCDCLVDNLFIEDGIPVVSGQSIITLSQARDNSSLMLYVPASQYREIEKGRQIQVNLASYPTSKYGALKASVVNVSASPVPGTMIRKKGQGLQNSTYFIIKAIINRVPKNVTLVTGMAVDSDIVIDETSLYELMFDLDKKAKLPE